MIALQVHPFSVLKEVCKNNNYPSTVKFIAANISEQQLCFRMTQCSFKGIFLLVELVEEGSDDFKNMQSAGSVVVVATGRYLLCDVSLCLRSEHVARVQLSSLSQIIPVTEFFSYISSRVTFFILHVGDFVCST